MDDALVEYYVAKALYLASRDTSNLIAQVDEADGIIVSWREANDGARCQELELAAARQYFFCRDVVAHNGPISVALVTVWLFGYTAMKKVLEWFGMSGLLAIGACPEPHKANLGDISWGMSGIADGLSDSATPTGP